MTVYKFGGTSLGSAERFARAARLVAECKEPPVVVVSAVEGVTNRLEKLARERDDPEEQRRGIAELRRIHREITGEIRRETGSGSGAGGRDGGTGTGDDEPGTGAAGSGDADEQRVEAIFLELERVLAEGGKPLFTGTDDGGAAGAKPEATVAASGVPAPARSPARFLDAVYAAGEDLSAELMVLTLRRIGIRARAVDAREIVRTDARFGRAIPLDEESYTLARERLTPLVDAGEVPVLQGFVGATAEGITTTLGRGGSDFTAAIVGAALGAKYVTIWTDVDGIYSADPNQVPDAQVIREIGYEEAVEISYFGARVIHPAAAKHAIAHDVSLIIRNSFRPEERGTLIRHDRRESTKVAAVACKPDVTLIRVRSRPLFMAHGFLAMVFDVLSRHRLPVDLVATSHSSTAFTIDMEEELDAVIAELDAFAEVEVLQGLSTVSVVGRGLMGEPGVSARILGALGAIPVYLVSQASDVSLSFLVASTHGVMAARYIHRALIAGDPFDGRRMSG
ncbi:MAG: aspartate kinase [Gemmatimonadota bacterium]